MAVTRVTIVEFGTGKRLTLKKRERGLFAEELKLALQRKAGKGVPRRIAPDAQITVRDGQKTTRYELYSEAVLRDVKTDRTWPFYFGFVILRWLEVVPSPPAPAPPPPP